MGFGIKLHCWGGLALFTRPEMKVERVSYDVITPSAARGILEAIYWKPQIRWSIDRLRVLRPIRFTSQRRNEVREKIRAAAVRSAMDAGEGSLGLYIQEERQQRAAQMLRDVAYIIEAHFELLGDQDQAGKHLDQFNRRARAGQCFTRPFLGTRECAADFELLEAGVTWPLDQLPPEERTQDFGWMLHDIDFASGNQARLFRATMIDGLIEVPPFNPAQI